MDEIIVWLRRLAAVMRLTSPHNERYAQPLEQAALDLQNGNKDAAQKILKEHEENAVSASNQRKYAAWLSMLANRVNQEGIHHGSGLETIGD